MKPDPPYGDPERAELLQLYGVAVDEYRFEVRLNWDRTRYYFAFSAALSGATIGLLRFEAHPLERFLVALFFFVGAVVCFIGRKVISKGQDYYHRAEAHMKTIEDQLQLHQATRSLRTTFGMEERARSIVASANERPIPKKRWTITRSYLFLMKLLMTVDCLAGAATFASIFVPLDWPNQKQQSAVNGRATSSVCSGAGAVVAPSATPTAPTVSAPLPVQVAPSATHAPPNTP